MTQHTIRRRCVAFLAIGAMAALAMPSTAQAAPQLADLGVKQSMSVKASNGERLEGKDLHAIQLATYTAASVDDNTIVGYDLTTNTALASDITAAAKTAGATDANLTINGKLYSSPADYIQLYRIEEAGHDVYAYLQKKGWDLPGMCLDHFQIPVI